MTLSAMLRSFDRRRRAGERGQAIVEATVFLPVMMLLLFGLIFFDRLGLAAERSESAVRYGDMVAFRQGQAYTVSTVADVLNQALYHNTPDQLLDLCLQPGTAANPTSGNVNASIAAALVQSEIAPNATGPAPEPSAKPFWKPDQIRSPKCAPGTIDLQQSSPTGVGNLPLSTNNFSITAGVDVPSFLRPIFSTSATGTTGVSNSGANMTFVNVATPSTLIACVPGLNIVLTIMNPGATGPVPCT